MVVIVVDVKYELREIVLLVGKYDVEVDLRCAVRVHVFPSLYTYTICTCFCEIHDVFFPSMIPI